MLPVVETSVVLAVSITVSEVSFVVSFTGVRVIEALVDPDTIVEDEEDRL